MSKIIVEEIIKKYNLEKHPEGGYYSETYRSIETISKENLDTRYTQSHSYGTCIYYLLTSETFSEMHQLETDEIFHFYLGDPIEMLQLYPDGKGKYVVIGNDISQDMSPQVIVPRGVWQGSRLIKGGEFALLGCTLAPGFEFVDYKSGKKADLIQKYPDFKDSITALTRK
jgi:predicted cupin superfamily sugar epimerase